MWPGRTLWVEMANTQKLENSEGGITDALPTPYVFSCLSVFFVEKSMVELLPFFSEVKPGRSMEIIEQLDGEVLIMGN